MPPSTTGLLIQLQARDDGVETHGKASDLRSSNSIVTAAWMDGLEAEYWDLSFCEVLALAAEQALTRASPFTTRIFQLTWVWPINFACTSLSTLLFLLRIESSNAWWKKSCVEGREMIVWPSGNESTAVHCYFYPSGAIKRSSVTASPHGVVPST